MTMPLTITAKKITVSSPYHQDLPRRARNVGGRWDPTKKCWIYDARDLEVVTDLYRDIYGYAPTSAEEDATTPKVDVTITVGEDPWYGDCGPLVLGGRILAKAYGRDSGARVGHGVIMRNGHIDSRGSAKNWHTLASAGTTFVARDVPLPQAHAMRDKAPREVAVEYEDPSEVGSAPLPCAADVATTKRTLEALLATGHTLAEAARHCGLDV